jgi:hypothetical protein
MIFPLHQTGSLSETKFWSENLKGRDHSQEVGEDGRITLEWTLEKKSGMLWTGII